MKKKIFTLFAMMCCVVGLQAETVTKTWDFSEYAEQVDLGGTTYTLTYDELTLVGNSGAQAGKEYVSAAAGFHCNGNSSSSRRYIKYTPQYDGTWTVTYRSNKATNTEDGTIVTDRITAIGTSVVNFSKEEDATSDVLAWGFTEGSTNKTISAQLEKGKTYYAYFANGGQSIMKLEYTYDDSDQPDDPDPDDPDPQPGDAPDITGMSLYYWDNFTKANLQTFADNATIQITGNLSKKIESGSSITIGNKSYASMKLSNGAQNTYVAPDGYAATKVVFFSYVNKDEQTDRPAHWKEVGGVNYDVESSGGEMMSFKNGAKPDIRTYEFSSPVRAFTFTNGGEQLCYVMAVELEESAAELVKIPAAGYATYVATGNVAVPEGVEAFIVTGVYDTYVSLQGINNVAAGTPVILKGNEGYYTLPVLEGDAVDASANMLRASNGDVSGSGIYVLANQNNVVGFYPLGADVVIPAGKAYLQVEGEAKSFLALEDVTAINNVEAASAHTSTIYNVAGQKVQNIKASGLYIVNGKKVFVK